MLSTRLGRTVYLLLAGVLLVTGLLLLRVNLARVGSAAAGFGSGSIQVERMSAAERPVEDEWLILAELR